MQQRDLGGESDASPTVVSTRKAFSSPCLKPGVSKGRRSKKNEERLRLQIGQREMHIHGITTYITTMFLYYYTRFYCNGFLTRMAQGSHDPGVRSTRCALDPSRYK